ncbi:hypothetical protein CDL12_19686 [Handroanthus impetiginosus]|uniref:Uncharacterized protein n=1 Tax=Handroanthus impetiginosus TaxID=429701 RepID=A0A2G9GR29_9LAMI|nr:hypothetical protein CDL12_19686 [Handroanthus impetiginosus]
MVLALQYNDLSQNANLDDDYYGCWHKDKEFVTEPRRGANVARKQKVEPSNQMPDVKKKRKHDHLSSSLKKTKCRTKKKVAFAVDKVCNDEDRLDLVENNMEDYSPIDLESYPEYVDLEDDQGCYMDKGKTMANDEKKKEHEDDTDSDVEILDSEAITEKAILGSFVPSKRFHYSMQEDLSRSSRGGEFRKQVLDVLRKPFDKEEYTRHQEAAKSYLGHHPDFHRKLKKYRYNQQKRLIIYRGFFFWLQVSVYMSFVCFRFPFNSLLSFA